MIKWFSNNSMVIFFGLIIFLFGYALWADEDIKEKFTKKCADAGGIVLYTSKSDASCYQANTQIVLKKD